MIKIAIVGCGPSGLFVFKKLVETKNDQFEIEIFERSGEPGKGMPYSREGANEEHITNVSGNEIPDLERSLTAWIKGLDEGTLSRFQIDKNDFNSYKVLPRLLFGQYLTDQFKILTRKAKQENISVTVHTGCEVKDIIDHPGQHNTEVVYEENERHTFDHVVICTGHSWPKNIEKKVTGYFDSPYPPEKLKMKINHPVAIRGSSLTAIDAVRTLAAYNGEFVEDKKLIPAYRLSENKGFKIVMHSLGALLPAVRFHLENSELGKGKLLSDEAIQKNKKENDGFLSLDFVFEEAFKKPIIQHDPEYFDKIRDMNLEAFVDFVMTSRNAMDPFELLLDEYIEAEISIEKRESIYWKEMLGVLSFVMNYPAKYFSAEDTIRLQKILKPLISIVIAYVPQSSVKELLALHNAGLLELVDVGKDSNVLPNKNGGATYTYTNDDGKKVSTYYQTFIDAIGQPHLSYSDLPFDSLLKNKTVSSARIKFREPANAEREKASGNEKIIINANGYYLNVPGIAINDDFQVVDAFGASNERIFMMAVPFIGGYNPDYSGLDFCDTASNFIVKRIMKNNKT